MKREKLREVLFTDWVRPRRRSEFVNKGYFHAWILDSKSILNPQYFALIEKEDGCMELVEFTEIKFIS